jgi:hypothetical protein
VVYNAIIMALVDLANLAELLAESPNVVDAPMRSRYHRQI